MTTTSKHLIRSLSLFALLVLLAGALMSPGVSLAETARATLRAALMDLVSGGGEEEEEAGPNAGPADPGPIDWMYGQRADGETIPRGALQRALAQRQEVKAATVATAPDYAAATWNHMGPTNFGGRVVEVAVDSTRSNLVTANNIGTANWVWAATASGGVWVSKNVGETFQYAWNPDLTQSMGALAVGSDGAVYAGTGEANPGGGSIVFGGTGIYRSKDGGGTWEHIGLPTSGAFGRIAVDPKDPKRVFAAAAGDLFIPGGERGLYRSLDGGDTWQRVLAGDNATTGAIDVAIDPVNPNNMLAAMWDHHRLSTHREYAGAGSGLYRSTDGGDTWQRITLPATGLSANDVGRIGVAFAPSNPNRAYAVIASRANGSGVGLWRSDDGGATWAKTAASAASLQQSTYGWWFGKIWVDPADPARLFVAGLELVESINNGDSFTAHTNTTAAVVTGGFQGGPVVHADQHGMAWDPEVPNRVYLGNDGGVYRSDANGRIGTFVVAKQQGWTQHYSVDVSEQAPDMIITGLQDNLCQKTEPAGPATPQTWHKVGICGDGLQTLINPVDPTWTYACAQYGACGVQRAEVPDPRRPGQLVGGKPPGQRYGWLTPLEFDPNNPAIMYFGSNIVSRSADNGITFSTISPDLTTQPVQHDPNAGYRIYGTITTLAVAKSDPNVMYVGTDDGLLWRGNNSNGTWSWTQLSDNDEVNDIPGTWVTRVAVDPTNADVAYVTYSSFRNGSQSPHVIKTTDGGTTWTEISGNLPDAPVNDIIVIGNRLAVGTDVGVFITEDGGTTWHLLGANLPSVPVFDLRYHAGSNTITAATFGHGIQRVTLP